MTIAALMLSGTAFYDRARVACSTWGKEFDVLEVHSFTPCADLPVRIVGTREGPRSCFEKRLMGLEAAARELPGADWYLACSCDNYFWRANLEAALDGWEKYSPPSEEHWNPRRPMLVGGHACELRIADGTLVRYPSGGAGYCLNRAALELIAGQMGELRAVWAIDSNNDDVEDAFMGWSAKQLGIPFIEHPGFFGCNPLAGTCHTLAQVPERPVSFHYVTPDQMIEIWNNGLPSRI